MVELITTPKEGIVIDIPLLKEDDTPIHKQVDIVTPITPETHLLRLTYATHAAIDAMEPSSHFDPIQDFFELFELEYRRI